VAERENPKHEVEVIEGRNVDLYTFEAPMWHDDFHKAEALGVVFAKYFDDGPDYWDASILYCRPEDVEAVQRFFAQD